MRAKAAPPNPDPPGTPMSPFVCVLYRHWLTYYCNLRANLFLQFGSKKYIMYAEIERDIYVMGISPIKQSPIDPSH